MKEDVNVDRNWPIEAISQGRRIPVLLVIAEMKSGSIEVAVKSQYGDLIGDKFRSEQEIVLGELARWALGSGLVLGCSAFAADSVRSGMTGYAMCYRKPSWRHVIPEMDLRHCFSPHPPERCDMAIRPPSGTGWLIDKLMMLSTRLTYLAERSDFRRAPSPARLAPAVGQVLRLFVGRLAVFVLIIGNGSKLALRPFNFVVESDYLPSTLLAVEFLADLVLSAEAGLLEAAGAEMVGSLATVPEGIGLRSLDCDSYEALASAISESVAVPLF